MSNPAVTGQVVTIEKLFINTPNISLYLFLKLMPENRKKPVWKKY